MTEKQRRWYEDALSAYVSGNGQRWNGNLTGKLTTAATACGLMAESVIADVAARMPNFSQVHAAKIRADMETAAKHQGIRFVPGERTAYRRPAEQDGFPNYVRELIAAGGGTATSGDLFDLSPVNVKPYAKDGRTATELFLRTLWMPHEILHVFAKERPIVGRIGCDLRTRDQWLDLLRTSPLPGDCIKKNPFTGRPGMNKQGAESYIADECIIEYRYALIEFDDLPIREQLAFWRGYLTKPNLAPTLASLTFSGGKSLHGLIRTNANALTAPTVHANLLKLFHADPTTRTEHDASGIEIVHYPFRADKGVLGRSGGTRIAGANRIDGNARKNGVMQTLIYLSDGSRTPTPQPAPMPTPGERPKDETPIIVTDAWQQPQANAHERTNGEHTRPHGAGALTENERKETHGPSAKDFARFSVADNVKERDTDENTECKTADEKQTSLKHSRPATTEEATTFATRCHECPTAADCKHAFGKFWLDRSHGGVGCSHPFKGWKIMLRPIRN